MADSKAKEAKVFIGGREPKTQDKTGRVRVYLTLVDADKGKTIPGNISSAIYINGDRKSVV